MTPTASYRIKPLVWEKVKGGQAQYRARVANIFNFYATRKAPRSRQWEREIFVGEECRDYEVHDSLEAAQLAAESWYRERLAAALEVVSCQGQD
jgi:hypothetical protein